MNAKPFFVVITFVLFIALFASGAMSSADLTPDTPPANTDSSGLMDLNNFPAAAGNPLDSPCGSSYTVRSGDTLSRIAQACNVTLNDLLASNPSILNPNLISPGQKLNIYYAPLPVAPTQPPAPAATAVKPAAMPAPADASIPVSGLVPGGSVHITVSGLPGNTPAEISIGKVNEKPVKLEDRSTDPNGKIDMSAAIPKTAKTGEQWIVTITTTTVPPVTVTSPPFVIQ